MAQLALSNLHLPLLLATDGCSDTRMAYQFLQPVADGLAAQLGSPSSSILTISEPLTLCLNTTSSEEEAELFTHSSPGALQQRRPTLRILNYAQEVQAGLIAVVWRSHRKKEAAGELPGGVALAIARFAPTPVLVMHETDTPSALRWDHVLLVVNASDATQGAIALTRQLIPAGVRRVTILCIQPPLNTHYLFGPFATPTPSWQLNQSLRQAQQEQSQAIVKQAEAVLQMPDLTVQTLVQMSDPGSLICQVAQQQQVNVIIMGSDATHRLSLAPYHPAFRGARLTPVADYVIRHTTCPVLLGRAMPAIANFKRFALPKLKLHVAAIPKPR